MKMRYSTAIIAELLILLAGCTDLVPVAADSAADDSALLAAESHGLAAAHSRDFERALTLAARGEH